MGGQILTIPEVAELLKINGKTANRLTAGGKYPDIRSVARGDFADRISIGESKDRMWRPNGSEARWLKRTRIRSK
jgi:hypothetical protein